MKQPLVTIICICYNHEPFVEEALKSVWELDYPNIELIVADDDSTDGSRELIRTLTREKKVTLVFNDANLGHCKTFNKALKAANGDFVIDLSADDVLVNGGVCEGVECLLGRGESYGVFFADAVLINDNGNEIGVHKTASFFNSKRVPEGDIYTTVLGKYFFSPPTLIFRRSIVDKLGGYDEQLTYEDFDFWVRSSRITKYCYSSLQTVKKRIHGESVSSKQYIKNSKMLESTLAVCRKAFQLNRSKGEDNALLRRLIYEGKMALASTNYKIGIKMMVLFVRVLFKIRT